MRRISTIGSIKWTAMAVLFLAVGWSPSSRADNTAIACYHAMLVETHALLNHCGDHIPTDAQQRYVELREQLEAFIRQHRPPDRKGYDVNELEMRIKSGRAPTCGEETHTDARGLFYALVSRSRVKAFQELLDKPKDPDNGDCL
jgi:hypothetical protein